MKPPRGFDEVSVWLDWSSFPISLRAGNLDGALAVASVVCKWDGVRVAMVQTNTLEAVSFRKGPDEKSTQGSGET